MCGITAFIGKKVDITKIKLLAVVNDERGKHSCGIYADRITWRGADKQARMPDFLANTLIPKFKNPKLVLCHSRLGTMGDWTTANSHPITIGWDTEGKLVTNDPNVEHSIVGVHNGKIENYFDLRKDFGDVMDIKEFNIDSKVLFGAILLNKDNPAAIFEKYTGAAALMYTYDDQSLFVFKGAAGGDEERPLFFLEEPEGIYFSSMAEPLWIIRTTDEPVYKVKENVLFKFTPQGIETSETFLRPESLGPYKYTPSKNEYIGAKSINYTRGVITTNEAKAPISSFPDVALTTIDKEANNKEIGNITFNQFRYKTGGQLMNGRYKITEYGWIRDNGDPYWFYEGLLVTEESYIEIVERVITSDEDLFVMMSHLSRYPILAFYLNDIYRNKVLPVGVTYKGKPYTGTVAPIFCDFYYTIADGKFMGKKKRKVKEDRKLAKDQMFIRNKKGKPINLLDPKCKHVYSTT